MARDPLSFQHFDFGMCCAPQQRANFGHLHLQKFWLENALRATAVSNFSFLISPHGSAPTALASLIFDPPDPGKTSCFATFLTFHAPVSSFACLFLFLSSTLLLCFSSLHIVGSLTSKPPLVTKYYNVLFPTTK